MSRQPRLTTLGQRVAWLIDQFCNGSVRAASEVWGIPRLRLLRLVGESVRSPRSPVLQRIAEATGTTAEWLRTGKGKAPEPPGPEALLITPWLARWQRLIDSLELTEGLREAVLALPGAIRRAFSLMVLRGHPLAVPIKAHEVRKKAEEFEVRAWFTLISGLIEQYGHDRVRSKLEAESLWLGLGFAPVAMELYVAQGIGDKPSVDQAAEQWEVAMRMARQLGSRVPPAQAPSLAAIAGSEGPPGLPESKSPSAPDAKKRR